MKNLARLMRTVFAPLCLVALLVGTASIARAGIIYGTGTAGNGTRDTEWQVLAVGGNNVSGNTPPYDAYVYTVVPQGWNGTGGFGQPQVGVTTADGTFRWIGPNPTPAAPFPADYNYIIGQRFTAEQAGTYNFSFSANGDNFFSFFLNGTISLADPVKPVIVGGTQIGQTSNDFQVLKTLTGSAFLNQGDNWAYAVINERGFDTGVLVTQSTFGVVPEPSTVAMGLAGIVIGGWAAVRRRKQA
jgi:hypothetical protein